MHIDAVGRRNAQLVLPCLALLSATAPVGGASLESLAVDTAAVQLSAVSAVQLTSTEGRRKPRGRRKKRRENQRSGQPLPVIAYDKPWTWGTYSTTGCLNTDDLELNQDECRSIALMDLSLDESLAVHVGNPWPVNSAMIPRGCSERMGDAVPPLMYYNTHSEGGAHSLYRPVCKEPGYSLYVGGCPAGFIDLDQAECLTACSSFKWLAAPMFGFSDSRSPKGCYGKAGYYYYNPHEFGTFGDPDAFNVCKVGNISAVDYSGSSATDDTIPHNGTLPNFPDDIMQPLHGASAAATVAPTPAPTPGAPLSGSISAVGDPHMTSITGSKFDIARPGNHTLLHVPRHAGQEAALINVRAFVKHEGSACLDMYINALQMTGKWADDMQPGGLSFFANQRGHGHWMRFGKMQLKVVWGTTLSGVKYLNVLAKHLNKLTMPIGGILGLDDHTEAATPEKHCRRTMSL
jgi:hypothetical protein